MFGVECWVLSVGCSLVFAALNCTLVTPGFPAHTDERAARAPKIIPMNQLRSKLEQNLGWIALLALLIGCLLVLRPFVSALLWAVVLCFSSWPIYRRLLGLVRNRRTLAAFLMTLAMVLILLLPFVIIGTTLADNVNQFTGAAKNWAQNGPPGPPSLP